MYQSEDRGGRPLVPRVPTEPGSPLCLACAALSCRGITGTNNPLPVSDPKTCWRTAGVGRGRGAAELHRDAGPAPDLSSKPSLGNLEGPAHTEARSKGCRAGEQA